MAFLQRLWARVWRSYCNHDPFAASPLRRLPYPLVAVAIAVLHIGTLSAGRLVIARGPQAVPAFPGFGTDLVIVLVFGPRYWPVLLAAYFANSLSRQVDWLASCGVSLASLLRTLCGAALVSWTSRRQEQLGAFEDLAAVALAGSVAGAAGAVAGASSLVLTGAIPPSQWIDVSKSWWIADALSAFVVSPALLALARASTGTRARTRPWFVLRSLLYLLGVAFGSYLVFFRLDSRYLFSVFLLILIAAAWLGRAEARYTALITSIAAVSATRMGVGAFAGGSLPDNLLNLALFLVAISFTGMAVGAFRAIGNLSLSGGVLLAGWALSGWLYGSLDLSRTTYDRSRFAGVIGFAENRIQSSYRAYEGLAWDAAGFVAVSGQFDVGRWNSYIGRLRLAERYPGLRTIAVIGGEPSGAPAGAAGVSWTAAERARDSGIAVLTPGGSDANPPAGELQLFVPVYRTGVPLTNAAERRTASIGWVNVRLDVDIFFHSALEDVRTPIRLRVAAEAPGASGNRVTVYGSEPANHAPPDRVTRLVMGANQWDLAWSPSPGFPFLSKKPFALAAGCTALLSLLLSGLVLILQTTWRRASDRWKLLQSTPSLGTWELDFDSQTIHCSEQLVRLYGIPEARDRFPVADWLAYVHPDDRPAIQAELGAQWGDRHSIDHQYRVVWPDGSIHWLHRKALPVAPYSGGSRRLVGVDFDISEMKKLQSELAQAQKLQSVGQLAAGVAHEINTPIQYIGDNGKFLQEATRDLIAFWDAQREAPALPSPAGLDERTLDFLRSEVPKATSQLLDGVDQVARIVRAMKEFSHPGPIEMSASDLNRAIENTILVCKSEWKYVAEVTTELDPDLPPVPCIVGEFNQVILNLIVNAAQAIADVVRQTGEKGGIHISTRKRDLVVEVRIADTGGGIPEPIQSKVFDPFFTTKPVGKGTGQGLAIAHNVIVQKHSGSLTFESQPGRGTTFLIQLPLAREWQTA